MKKPNATLMILITILSTHINASATELKVEEKPNATSAYLGVSTSPVGDVLAKQLNIKKGLGLVVEYIDPTSPASEKLKIGDIITKVNDQIMINHAQFAIFIKTFNPGDEVDIQILRGGIEKSNSIKLGEKEIDAHEKNNHPWKLPNVFIPPPSFATFPSRLNHLNSTVNLEDFLKTMEDELFDNNIEKETIDNISQKLKGIIHVMPYPSETQSSYSSSHVSSFSTTTKNTTMTMTTNNKGQKHLVIQNRNGNIIFNGQINTKEQRKKLSKEQTEQLEALEAFENSENFSGFSRFF